jgi:hypothetical protein
MLSKKRADTCVLKRLYDGQFRGCWYTSEQLKYEPRTVCRDQRGHRNLPRAQRLEQAFGKRMCTLR